MADASAVSSLNPFRFRPPKDGKTVAWLDYLSRAGYIAKGLVYGSVGVLAGKAAFEANNSAPGTQDVFQVMLNAPFGRVLLAVTAVGILGYVVWRGVQVVLDPGGKGTGVKGWLIRAAFGVSGVFYLMMAVRAGWAAWMGTAGEAGDGGADNEAGQTATGIALGLPLGWAAVAAAGLVFVGVGLHHFYRAYTAKFMKEYDHTEMSDTERAWLKPIGIAGLTARGVTFLLIGAFLTRAGWRENTGDVTGLEGAFEALAEPWWGWMGLAAVSAGFVLYGVYCFSRAKYRRFVKGEV